MGESAAQGLQLGQVKVLPVKRRGDSEPSGDQAVHRRPPYVFIVPGRPMQGPAVPGGQVEAAEGDEPAVGPGDVDAAAAEPVEIQAPGVLKSHGRDSKGMAAGLTEKLIEAITRFGAVCLAGR